VATKSERLHHVPVFALVSLYDYTFFGRLSAAGAFTIFTSMVTLVNALAATKCGGRGSVGCYDDNTVESERPRPTTRRWSESHVKGGEPRSTTVYEVKELKTFTNEKKKIRVCLCVRRSFE